MSDEVILVFALCGSCLSTQALNWVQKSQPTASLVSIASESQGTVKILHDEDAIRLVSGGPIGIKALLRAFKGIKVIRRSHPDKAVIIQ